MKLFSILTFMAVITAAILSADCLKVSAQENEIREYHISQDGSGDFSTIQEAVNHARNGDILIIHPGIYTENVIVLDKVLYLMGTDRDTCILQYDTADYRTVPLSIAAGGVSNLTIKGLDTGTILPSSVNEIPAADNSSLDETLDCYSGYAVHIEQDFLFQKSLCFSNCRIVSWHNFCVGLGSRGNSTVLFEDCELAAYGNGGCIFFHDSVFDEFCGDSSLIIRDCRMISCFSPYIMAFQTYNAASRTSLTFQNVKVSAVAYINDSIYDSNDMNTSDTVEELAKREAAGQLYDNRLVYLLTPEDSIRFLSWRNRIWHTKSFPDPAESVFPEGILYIALTYETAPAQSHHVIGISNYSGRPEQGWCGLHNTSLTADSCGNTLPEMNASP